MSVSLVTAFKQYTSSITELIEKISGCCSYSDLIPLLDEYIENQADCCDTLTVKIDTLKTLFSELPCIIPIVVTTTTTIAVVTSTTTVETLTTTAETGTTTSTPGQEVCDSVTEIHKKSTSYPYMIVKYLGTDTGLVTLTFDSFDIPDRFVVEFDGVDVIDTGYVGDSVFQDYLDAAVAEYGDVAGTIVNNPIGTYTFEKLTDSEYAVVKVYAPLKNTAFEFTLSCPQPYTSTTTTIVTSTTTTNCVGCDRYLLQNTVNDGTPTSFDVVLCNQEVIDIDVYYGLNSIVCLSACSPVAADPTRGSITLVEECFEATTTTTTTVAPVVTTTTTTAVQTTTTTVALTTTTTATPGPTTTTTTGPITTTTTADPSITTTTTTVNPALTTTTTTGAVTTTTTTVAGTTTTTAAPTSTTTTTSPVTTTTTTSEPCVEGYGLLYNYLAVKDARNIAPIGWHVPTKAEYDILIASSDGNLTAGGHLKKSGLTYWTEDKGDNTTGFGAVGSGGRNASTGLFESINEITYLWASDYFTYDGIDYGSALNLLSTKYNAYTVYVSGHRWGFPLRFVKDDSTDNGTMVDNNGNSYNTVKIGDQVWMAENARTTKYRNGDSITSITNNINWIATNSGAYSTYYNDTNYVCNIVTTTTTTAPVTTTTTTIFGDCIVYGLLYNYYTVVDARNIANTGWHVPDAPEWETLASFIEPGYSNVTNTIGGVLKESGTVYWDSPNTGAINSVGFNGRAAGQRSTTGDFTQIKSTLGMWTTTQHPDIAENAKIARPTYSIATMTVPKVASYLHTDKNVGYSVRLVKDATDLVNGQTGTYIGNDGKHYHTICIGTQEWLSENLSETKYRNEDLIDVVEDNTDWSNLNTGAVCAYENNLNNVGCNFTFPEVATTTTTTGG